MPGESSQATAVGSCTWWIISNLSQVTDTAALISGICSILLPQPRPLVLLLLPYLNESVLFVKLPIFNIFILIFIPIFSFSFYLLLWDVYHPPKDRMTSSPNGVSHPAERPDSQSQFLQLTVGQSVSLSLGSDSLLILGMFSLDNQRLPY